MQRTIIIVTLIIVASLSTFGQMSAKKPDKTSKAKEQVTALATEFANALVKGDTATLDRILSDDYADVTPGGFPTPKKLYIDYFKLNANTPVLEAININLNLSYIRIYDDTAIMVVPATAKWRGANNQTEEQTFTATLVAIKKKGRWQFMAAHYSELIKSQETQLRQSK
jgi:Domain of unknown function (DUF4440)